MKRPRPHIPLAVRIAVLKRQAQALDLSIDYAALDAMRIADDRARVLLNALFPDVACHLDHDPPLRVREFNPRTGKYTPDANDPNFLIYRTVEDHRIKTFVRGEHGQFSDVALIKREKRRLRGKKPTRKIAQRKKQQWPKRQFRSSR